MKSHCLFGEALKSWAMCLSVWERSLQYRLFGRGVQISTSCLMLFMLLFFSKPQ